jgi:FkbM family methyltransferase
MLKTNKWVPDEMWSSRFSFSQFGEDLVLASLFHRNKISQGNFVDVGAFHPIKLSNTYFFYRQGWRGVNVEPNPEGFRLFLDRRPADTNLNCAVSQACKEVEFVCDSAFSGINGPKYEFRSGNPAPKIINIQSKPLRDIFAENLNGVQITFLSTDCEGYDLEVLQSNAWDKYRPLVILTELQGQKKEGPIFDYLADVGYEFYVKIGLTGFFMQKEYSWIY